MRKRRRGGGNIHHEFSEVLLVECNAVHTIFTIVGLRAELTTDCDLGSKSHNTHPNLIRYESRYGLVDISRVRREECSKNDQGLTGSMTWGMTKGKAAVSVVE